MAPKKAEANADYTIPALRQGRLTIQVLGTSPLIYNAVSLKAKQTLLLPKGRKTAADKASSLKHDPLLEYRSSVYAHREDEQPTRLFFPGGGFHKSIENVAKRIPGIARTEIAQLTWVTDYNVNIFGVPQMFMAITRSADMARTPDVRTRAILPEWAATFTIEYVSPPLSDTAIINLIHNAGQLCGIGDGRQEKGYGHGQFKIVSADDKAAVKAFASVLKNGGLAAQDAALAEPSFFDRETDELFSWYTTEVAKMGDRFARPSLAAVDGEAVEEGETEEAEAA